MNTVQLKLEDEYHDKLLAFCMRNGATKSDAIRYMIDTLKLTGRAMSNLTDGMTIDTTLPDEQAGTQVAENQALPDLSDILSSIDFNAKPMEYGKTANQGHFHVGKWGALILELIANPADEESILETYA